MPSKNSLKLYSDDSYYHIYNRGVEKRLIFQDQQDYRVFLSYLKEYLSPKDEEALSNKLLDPLISSKERDKILKSLRLNNFFGEINLIAYCLMPNHFHLLIKQNSAVSMDKFMNSLGTRYTIYFNRKYIRVGSLYQDVYKAISVESEPQLLYLTNYIHRNPIKSASQEDAREAITSQPSSYPEYLGQRKTKWIHPEDILSFFSKTDPRNSYQNFVEGTKDLSSLIEPIQDLMLDI
ncbi:MAG: transposase [Candidatus Daviesbacteria bacterium]|nr:transposase [Candidatus Daviesbacteria bacterium]